MAAISHESAVALANQPPLSSTAPLPAPSASTPSLAGPLLVWLLLQSGALFLAAGRVPLSARYPEAAERLAIDLLVVMQIAASAALLPLLFRSAWLTAAVIASSWPMLTLAAMLSSVTPARAGLAGLYLALWMIALAVWRAALPARRAHFTLTAIALLWSVGGALLRYLDSEFAAPGTSAPARFTDGPILSAFSLVADGKLPVSAWATLATIIIAGAVVIGIRRRARR